MALFPPCRSQFLNLTTELYSSRYVCYCDKLRSELAVGRQCLLMHIQACCHILCNELHGAEPCSQEATTVPYYLPAECSPQSNPPLFNSRRTQWHENRLRPPKHWGRGFESHSRVGCLHALIMCVLFCV
jgi:hypothetical protein